MGTILRGDLGIVMSGKYLHICTLWTSRDLSIGVSEWESVCLAECFHSVALIILRDHQNTRRSTRGAVGLVLGRDVRVECKVARSTLPVGPVFEVVGRARREILQLRRVGDAEEMRQAEAEGLMEEEQVRVYITCVSCSMAWTIHI